jgi:hypothetical protein
MSISHTIVPGPETEQQWVEACQRARAAQACKSSHFCYRWDNVINAHLNLPVVEEPCTVCDLYDQRKAKVMQGEMPPFYLVCYGVSRYCYSQAEGGCWADWTEILEVRKAYTFRQALKHARELKEKYPTQRYNRFSVLGNGDDTYLRICYSEDDPRWPQESTQRAQYS